MARLQFIVVSVILLGILTVHADPQIDLRTNRTIFGKSAFDNADSQKAVKRLILTPRSDPNFANQLPSHSCTGDTDESRRQEVRRITGERIARVQARIRQHEETVRQGEKKKQEQQKKQKYYQRQKLFREQNPEVAEAFRKHRAEIMKRYNERQKLLREKNPVLAEIHRERQRIADYRFQKRQKARLAKSEALKRLP